MQKVFEITNDFVAQEKKKSKEPHLWTQTCRELMRESRERKGEVK